MMYVNTEGLTMNSDIKVRLISRLMIERGISQEKRNHYNTVKQSSGYSSCGAQVCLPFFFRLRNKNHRGTHP
jgi:hypothetical protein